MTDSAILVVDDEQPLLEDLQWVAEEVSGSNVTAAKSAREAMGLIRERDFDLIITDLRMETEEAGMDVLAAAKEKNRNTKLILVTAFGKPNPIGPTAILEGAYDYIDRNAPGNYLHRLRETIAPALAKQG
uniref:Response regulator receiver domain-containing protein n=1 Tax=Candidatus Kentrum sp. DK TaxID=2126562 RepID=A0A450SW45_9GAMM|nr:MAG: Response regulator receiver domain-containing protein [Candidatus Kentron sp. DK]